MRGNLREKLGKCAIAAPDILIPAKGVDASKWAVVACDQFTSEPSYWEEAGKIAGDSPSALRLIFPECWLESGDKEAITRSVNQAMEDYLAKGVFEERRETFVLVRRTTESGSRLGLVAALDLEAYSYEKGSKSLVRATEGTILSRIPPRKGIRKNASLELPHIMVLINDPGRSVIEPLAAKADRLEKLYDTELMLGGGRLEGWAVDSDEDMEQIAGALSGLMAKLDPENPLLYAMGDGNHSLATAKSIWEDLKAEKGEAALSSPARWALVELENIFDPALNFEAIHRVFFGLTKDELEDELAKEASAIREERARTGEEMLERVNEDDGLVKLGLATADGFWTIVLEGSRHALAASAVQKAIDSLLEAGNAEVDYIHGVEATVRLARSGDNVGVVLPDISKDNFFEAILKDGAFPRKTFSIGHAEEKRYYMEARRIR